MMRKNKRMIVAILATIVVIVGLLWLIGGRVKKENQVNNTSADNSAGENLSGLSFSDFYRQIRAGGENIEQLINTGLITRDLRSEATTLNPNNLTDLYKESDLTTDGNTKTNLENYGQKLAEILKPFAAERENEARLMLAVLDNHSDLNSIAKLKKSANLHEQAASRLLNITVPRSAIPVHLELLNSAALQARLIGNMVEAPDEPVLALESAMAYQINSPRFFNTISGLNEYFTNYNILFGEAEQVKIYINFEP